MKTTVEETPNEVANKKIIAEIKIKLKGKSYYEISEILSATQIELMNEITY